MPTQADKGITFRALHHRETAFIIPNPWDIGTARMLAHLGYEALASTSAGYAFSIGKQDGAVGRDAMLAHISQLSSATDLPLSGDLENGFGDAPETAAETIRLAAEAGLVGGSIEDATGRDGDPIYEMEFAAERVRAAVESARALPFTFTLTARAENYLHGRADLGDTIRRLQAYQEAGADVLYAPGLTTEEEIASVISEVDRPVNFLAGMKGLRLGLAELSALGVKRISIGSALSRAALGAFLRASREMQEKGTFSYVDEAATSAEIGAMFKR